MKYILLLFISFLSLSASAQYHTLSTEQQLELKKQEIRKKIAFDYSVPDYETKKLDAKVMGWRLAKMLQFLEKNYTQGFYNRMLSKIRSLQMNDMKYGYWNVDNIKILNVQKQDSVIRIKINTYTKRDREKVNYDITLSFVNSFSDDETANNLFVDIGRYIKKDE